MLTETASSIFELSEEQLAVRDAARALGHPVGLQDRWASGIDHGWSRGRRRGTPGKWVDEPVPPEHAVEAEGTESMEGPEAAVPARAGGSAGTGSPGVAAEPGTTPADPNTIPQQVLEVAETREQVRRLAAGAFKGQRISAMDARITALVDELLDGLESGLIDAAILYERDLRGEQRVVDERQFPRIETGVGGK